MLDFNTAEGVVLTLPFLGVVGGCQYDQYSGNVRPKEFMNTHPSVNGFGLDERWRRARLSLDEVVHNAPSRHRHDAALGTNPHESRARRGRRSGRRGEHARTVRRRLMSRQPRVVGRAELSVTEQKMVLGDSQGT